MAPSWENCYDSEPACPTNTLSPHEGARSEGTDTLSACSTDLPTDDAGYKAEGVSKNNLLEIVVLNLSCRDREPVEFEVLDVPIESGVVTRDRSQVHHPIPLQRKARSGCVKSLGALDPAVVCVDRPSFHQGKDAPSIDIQAASLGRSCQRVDQRFLDEIVIFSRQPIGASKNDLLERWVQVEYVLFLLIIYRG